jgi:uncharacterized protein (DUF4415 family)
MPSRKNVGPATNSTRAAPPIARVTRPSQDRVQEVLDYQATRPRRRNYPSKTKSLLSIRIDNDVIEHFKATGEDWKAGINDALRKVAGLGAG